MMTSSGSGAYRVGGSLPSSNLSPLAPPFMVDKSFSKPNSTNPSLNLVEGVVYGTGFDPAAGQFWNSSTSSTSGLNCVVSEAVVTNTNCSSSPNMYGYHDSQSSTLPAGVYYGSGKAVVTNTNCSSSPNMYEYQDSQSSTMPAGAYYGSGKAVVTDMNCSSSPNMYGYQDSQSSTLPVGAYYGNGNGVSAFDPFAYGPFPNSMHSSTNEEKSYFVPYVPPPPQKDGYLSLGVGSEPGCDSLSYSGSAHLSGCVPAQVDHAQNNPNDGRSKPKWGSFWSGLNENEYGKWTDVQGFAPKDSNLSSNKSSISVHGSNMSQPSVGINVHPFGDESGSNCKFDDVSSLNHLKSGASLTLDLGLHGQVSTAKNNCFDIFGGAYSLGCLGIQQEGCKSLSDCSNTKTSASASVSKETAHLPAPVLESISSLFGSQRASSSPEGQFREPGFFMFGASTTSTIPKSMTELPYGGMVSSVENTPSAVKLNSMGNNAANQSNTTGEYNFTYQLEAQMPLSLKRLSPIRIKKPVSTAASSFQKGEIDNSRLDDKVSSEQMKITSQVPDQLSLHGLNMEDSDAEAVYSTEKNSAELDGHNPAEDSPCWKGASSHRFSLFGFSESSDSDVKKSDRSQGLSSQNLQNNSIHSHTFGSKDFSSGQVNEVTSLKKPPVYDCALNSSVEYGSANPKSCLFDLNTGDGLQFADNCHSSMVECNMINKSKAILSEALPSGKCGFGTSVAEDCFSGLPSNVDYDNRFSGLQSNIDNNKSNMVPGNKANLPFAGEDSNSRIDVNVLLRTMMNLSETLRCYYFSNQAEVSENHSLAIKQILRNLNASMLLMSGQSMPTNVLSSSNKCSLKKSPVVHMVTDADACAGSLKLGGTTEDFLDGISCKDDSNSFEDANMAEAVKKLISKDFQEEEMDQKKLMYKNLWLEAEATLGVMTAKARFLRWKTEMKRTRDGTKDKDSLTISNVCMGLHKDIELANDDRCSLSHGEHPKLTTTSQHDRVKAFHDPKSMVENLVFSESERSTSTKNGTTFSSLCASRPVASNKNEDLCSTRHVNDVENCVMTRYKVLKNRVSCTDSLNNGSKVTSGEHQCSSSEFNVGNIFSASSKDTKAKDLQTSVFDGYQILNGQDGNSSHLNYEGKLLRGDENYFLDDDCLSHDNTFPNSQMSNSLGVCVTDKSEASVMARFRLLQSRVDHLNSLVSTLTPGQVSAVVVEDGTEDMGGCQKKGNVKETSFGPYPLWTEDENVDSFDNVVNEQTFAPTTKTNRISSVILDGWYDNNDCSSSDWEHIPRVDG